MYSNLWSWRQLKIDLKKSVWEVSKWLITSGRSFNFKWLCKWDCAYGLEGDKGILIQKPFQKILTAWFVLHYCVRVKSSDFHHKMFGLLLRRSKPPPSVQSGSQAHTNQYRQRETSAYRPVTHWLRRIITHSHCPLKQLSCVKVKAKVINNTTLFLI